MHFSCMMALGLNCMKYSGGWSGCIPVLWSYMYGKCWCFLPEAGWRQKSKTLHTVAMLWW